MLRITVVIKLLYPKHCSLGDNIGLWSYDLTALYKPIIRLPVRSDINIKVTGRQKWAEGRPLHGRN